MALGISMTPPMTDPAGGEARREVGLEGTPISADALLAKGYREFKDNYSKADRHFQKRFDDERGKRFFVNFRQWDFTQYGQGLSYDAQIACDTSTDGHLWATMKETTIEAVEARAEMLWRAVGGVYYEAWEPTPPAVSPQPGAGEEGDDA